MRAPPDTGGSRVNRTIALTGATGFIGGTLARQLHAGGWQVRALVRPGSKQTQLTGIAAELVEGRLEDDASLRRLTAGTAAVIHCAGAVRGITRADFDRVNVAGVARLAQAAATREPPPRFLLISSLAAREPGLSHYAASKHRGELALVETAGAMEWTALRPPAVYGPGDKELLPLFVWIGRGVVPVVSSPGARFSLIYVEDLAAAVLRWLENGRCERRVFELHDGRQGGYDWEDVIEISGGCWRGAYGACRSVGWPRWRR